MKVYIVRHYHNIVIEKTLEKDFYLMNKKSYINKCENALRSGKLDVWGENRVIELMIVKGRADNGC